MSWVPYSTDQLGGSVHNLHKLHNAKIALQHRKSLQTNKLCTLFVRKHADEKNA
jgi:hypothetical protein